MEVDFTGADRDWLLKPILGKLNEMEKNIMAQIDDLNAAIKAEDVELTTTQASIVAIAADIAKLKAAAAGGATPQDLTTQITAIQAHLAALTTANQQLVDADKAANT